MFQLDVKNAFFYDELEEDVDMEQPPGYVAQGKNMVGKFKKAIYGLDQSSQTWFDKFSSIISEVGFQKCYSDHSAFVRRSSSGITILVVYVDDILLSE